MLLLYKSPRVNEALHEVLRWRATYINTSRSKEHCEIHSHELPVFWLSLLLNSATPFGFPVCHAHTSIVPCAFNCFLDIPIVCSIRFLVCQSELCNPLP